MGLTSQNVMTEGSRLQVRPVPRLVLDHRLAMFHESQKWLAVADLHYGYELSHLAAGSLVPCWGMDDIRVRLRELLDFYAPTRLILLGDQVHDKRGATEFGEFLRELEQRTEVTLICGNHDRRALPLAMMHEVWREGEFVFFHGDREIAAEAEADRVHICGHYHPAVTLGDGAGLRVKLPAFVQDEDRWILPAFSPWAAGGTMRGLSQSPRKWACHRSGIMPIA